MPFQVILQQNIPQGEKLYMFIINFSYEVLHSLRMAEHARWLPENYFSTLRNLEHISDVGTRWLCKQIHA